MNEYNSIFFFMYQCVFFRHTPYKKGLRTPKGRAGCGHLWTSESAGQSSSILAIAFQNFFFHRFFFKEVSFQHILSFSFKFSMKDGGLLGEKFCFDFLHFFAKFPLKFMPLSSRLQLFHQFLVRPQTGTPTAGHQLQPKCPVGNST